MTLPITKPLSSNRPPPPHNIWVSHVSISQSTECPKTISSQIFIKISKRFGTRCWGNVKYFFTKLGVSPTPPNKGLVVGESSSRFWKEYLGQPKKNRQCLSPRFLCANPGKYHLILNPSSTEINRIFIYFVHYSKTIVLASIILRWVLFLF